MRYTKFMMKTSLQYPYVKLKEKISFRMVATCHDDINFVNNKIKCLVWLLIFGERIV